MIMIASNREQLLRGVLNDPFDDAPRLVYADWLEEGGEEERAEFIRVQVELDSLLIGVNRQSCGALDLICDPDSSADQEWKHRVLALCGRERELLATEGKPIWGTMSKIRPEGITTQAYRWASPYLLASLDWPIFRRGFVDQITLTCDDFVKDAEAIFAAEPVTKVRLSDKNPHEFTGWQCGVNDYGEIGERPSELPETVFRHLLGDGVYGNVYLYSSDAKANEGVSRACVDYGRHVAKLPKIDWSVRS